MNQSHKKVRKFGDWELISRLGRGGNGDVWLCQKFDRQHKAIKFLTKLKPKPYSRFIDETTVIEQNSDIKGIIPIEEKSLPEDPNMRIPYVCNAFG